MLLSKLFLCSMYGNLDVMICFSSLVCSMFFTELYILHLGPVTIVLIASLSVLLTTLLGDPYDT